MFVLLLNWAKRTPGLMIDDALAAEQAKAHILACLEIENRCVFR